MSCFYTHSPQLKSGHIGIIDYHCSFIYGIMNCQLSYVLLAGNSLRTAVFHQICLKKAVMSQWLCSCFYFQFLGLTCSTIPSLLGESPRVRFLKCPDAYPTCWKNRLRVYPVCKNVCPSVGHKKKACGFIKILKKSTSRNGAPFTWTQHVVSYEQLKLYFFIIVAGHQVLH